MQISFIKRVQIVMIHCPPGYDVKAERVVNHHYVYPLDQKKQFCGGSDSIILYRPAKWSFHHSARPHEGVIPTRPQLNSIHLENFDINHHRRNHTFKFSREAFTCDDG